MTGLLAKKNSPMLQSAGGVPLSSLRTLLSSSSIGSWIAAAEAA
jgi:hypothetical protein